MIIYDANQMEEWRDIVGHEGRYQVSSFGNIKSLDTLVIYSNGKRRIHKGKVLKPGINTSGYYNITLVKHTKKHSVMIHRMVAQAFLGLDVTSEMTVNHKDSNKLNNHVDNLEVVTLSENRQHYLTNIYYANQSL